MMEPTLKDFGRSLAEEIPSMGPTKVIRFLRRAGFLKKGRKINEPTEKAKGLLGVRRVTTYGGKKKSVHPQVFVT